METLDIVKELCKEKGLSIAQLESNLNYGNGSIAKSKGNMSAERMYNIAQYFGVSMEYLLTGKTISEADDELSLLRQQQSILMEINKISQMMSDYYKQIAECQDKLTSLKKEYNKLESKKNPNAQMTIQSDNTDNKWTVSVPPQLPFDSELPFQ